jgi:hypothetical protein
VVITEGVPKSVGRVASRLYGFPYRRLCRSALQSTSLHRGRQVAEGVDFKLMEVITVLDKLATERVQCRSSRVAMLKVDNRRLDPAGQNLFDHLAVVPLARLSRADQFS